MAAGPVSIPTLRIGELLEGRWMIISKLGEGSFGSVYEASDTKGVLKERLALKLESRKVETEVLKMEVAVLMATQHSRHVCRLYSAGRNETYNFMLMSVLGSTLEMLQNQAAGKKFSESTSVRVLVQCVKAIKDMHESGWLHRDIKPSNFAIGSNASTRGTIYIFDFGLSRNFLMSDRTLRPPRESAGLRGTPRYCSINAHLNKELGRHDDLISLMYMFVELVKAELPWKMEELDDKVHAAKLVAHSTLYNDMPAKMPVIHKYLYSLTYEQTPDYGMVEEMAMDLINKNNYLDDRYDWEKPKTPSSSMKMI